MKKHALKVAITIILALATLVVFAQNSNLVSEIIEARASTDSLADYSDFKEKAEKNISTNLKIIQQLKSLKLKGNNETKAKYRDDVNRLEEKNSEMAIKIGVSDLVATRNWTAFKRDFNKEILELTITLRNFSDNYSIQR